MGKFRNGELATWVGGNLTVFGALPRYSIFCLLPITTVAPEIAALRDCVLGDWGIRNVSLKSWAHGTTETCMAVVPKPMRPFCTASAQRTLQPSRQAERPAQGGSRNGERKLSKSTLNPMRSCPNSPLLNLPIRQVMGVAHYLPQPALPEVPGRGSTRVVGRARGRAIAGAVLPRRILAAGQNRRHRLPEQDRDLRPAVQGLIRDHAHHRSRSEASRRSDWHLVRPPHLGLGDDPTPSLMMPGIIISLIFLE